MTCLQPSNLDPQFPTDVAKFVRMGTLTNIFFFANTPSAKENLKTPKHVTYFWQKRFPRGKSTGKSSGFVWRKQMHYYYSLCVTKYHQSLVKYVSGGLRVSLAAVRLLWTTVSPGFHDSVRFWWMLQMKWRRINHAGDGLDRLDRGGHVEQFLCSKSDRKQQNDITYGIKWRLIN